MGTSGFHMHLDVHAATAHLLASIAPLSLTVLHPSVHDGATTGTATGRSRATAA